MTSRACAFAVTIVALSTAALLAQATAPPQADTFTFREGRSQMLTATMAPSPDGASELVWPDGVAAGWDTALVRISMRADEAPAVPFIEITSGGRADRQYFRPGEAGGRWVNVSFLREGLKGRERVTFRPTGMTLEAGEATVRLFATRPDLSKKILVLAPHPDDAEIGGFGTWAFRDATVVTLTSGNAGSATYEAVFTSNDVAAQYQFKGRIRTIDSITVPLIGGIPPERAYNLGYFDARLLEMYRRPGEVVTEMYGANTDISVYRKENVSSLLSRGRRQSTWRNLVDDVEQLLKKVKPEVILAPHPQLDTHRDHQMTAVALAEALRRRTSRVTLLLYTNHADGNRYPYGPAGTITSLPPPVATEVVFDRIYSHPVSPELQRTKLFALESMHDLRYSPTRQYQLALGEGRSTEPEKQGPGPDISYLRRGPRSNELFFVHDQDTIRPMIARFLASLPPPMPPAR